jgi:hypothetical protein
MKLAHLLAASDHYRLHGVFLRSMPRHEVTLVESELIRRLATGEE